MYDVNLHQRCILAIGKTGNGKSFTGTIFGAQDAEVGNGTKSKTEKVTFHDIGNSSFYVDTPGFDDSDEDKDDAETVRLIFRTMVDKKIRNITTILWFVVADVRATTSFKREARFIESLAQYHNGNVWDNTIIVTKGDHIDQGPREAAKEITKEIYQKKNGEPVDKKEDLLAKTGDFKILLFESLEDNSVYVRVNFTSDELNSYGVFKGSEPKRILAKYESLMKEHLEHPIPLIFKRVKCLRCPEETDPRLAVPKCHMEVEWIHDNKKGAHLGKNIQEHTKDLVRYHPDLTEQYHPSTTEWVHTGKPYGGETKQVLDNSPGAWILRTVTMWKVNITWPEIIPMHWDCCDKDIRAPGCTLVYRCCKKESGDAGCKQRYRCCQAEASPGCDNRYDCCKRPPQSEGCKGFYEQCKHEVGEKPCFSFCTNCGEEWGSKGCRGICTYCKKVRAESEGCVETTHDWPPLQNK
ncbi:5308_t:CDS:2 [Ambispora gerdemannii]|uniref:5308_t:CDS:1 n=1 Tax=Ambispora gerdemannii TaxID=144530 RepID=A0A9N9A9I6_9GLOM|nr:5308_t:CDS:2 [Ambispora gerdemannii]